MRKERVDPTTVTYLILRVPKGKSCTTARVLAVVLLRKSAHAAGSGRVRSTTWLVRIVGWGSIPSPAYANLYYPLGL
jgi:hypothetical protein